MVEKEAIVGGRSRLSSAVGSDLGEIDLSDLDHCVLCFNEMKVVIVGVCNHKNVCLTCALRVRIIMEETKC